MYFSIRDKYFSASTTALVFYDYVLTFEDEVSRVVKRPCDSVADSNLRYDMLGEDEKRGVSAPRM